MRGRIIGKIEEGRKITDVAREFDIAHSVVSRLWKSFKTTGMCSRRHGGGRVRSTTPAEDRYIVLSAKGTGAPQLSRQVAGRNYPPTNKNTLIRALTEEWDTLPQQLLDNVVQKYGGKQNRSFQCFRVDSLSTHLKRGRLPQTPRKTLGVPAHTMCRFRSESVVGAMSDEGPRNILGCTCGHGWRNATYFGKPILQLRGGKRYTPHSSKFHITKDERGSVQSK
ncbi:hypothetical protein TNCV_2867571 [Trichonephila clavipes]|nr:hypothetical protein TNCV_2867571 [Trichonephila clavipes]